MAEEPVVIVDRDQVDQGQGGDVPAGTSTAPIMELIDQPITEQSGVADQGAE